MEMKWEENIHIHIFELQTIAETSRHIKNTCSVLIKCRHLAKWSVLWPRNVPHFMGSVLYIELNQLLLCRWGIDSAWELKAQGKSPTASGWTMARRYFLGFQCRILLVKVLAHKLGGAWVWTRTFPRLISRNLKSGVGSVAQESAFCGFLKVAGGPGEVATNWWQIPFCHPWIGDCRYLERKPEHSVSFIFSSMFVLAHRSWDQRSAACYLQEGNMVH